VEKTAQLGALWFVLFTKYNYNNQVKEDEMGRACSTNGVKGNVYRLLAGKLKGKRQLERPRHRWMDNNRMDLGEVGCGWCGLDWSGSG
jgi:hypothetical protein